MRTIILIFLLNATTLGFCQTSLPSFDLTYGKYSAGYTHYRKYDQSRSYHEIYSWSKDVTARPVDISVWYPAQSSGEAKRMHVSDYLHVIKHEEEWPMLPDDKILGWFAYPDNLENRKRLKIETKSIRDGKEMVGKFPVVIYAPGYQSSSVENFVLCEFLATHGYIVLASPSKGSNNRFMNGATASDLDAQSRDIQFLITEARNLPHANISNVSVIGHSFGGMANILARMQSDFIKILVCLDGSVKYQLPTLEASPSYDLGKLNTPFLFVAQKDIPRRVMLEDGIDSTLNDSFRFFDSLKNGNCFYKKSKFLTHGQFTSMGVLFDPRDPRQDHSDDAIVNSYRELSVCVLNFLEVFQKGTSTKFETTSLESLITIAAREAYEPGKTFEDFISLLRREGFSGIDSLYLRIKTEHADFTAAEWKLNSLGLQLIFSGKHADGMRVLTFTTRLYPHSSNAFDSLAEAYLFRGDTINAMKNFARALELDPHNSNSAHQLEKLSKSN